MMSLKTTSFVASFLCIGALSVGSAQAMDIAQHQGRLIVTGGNFRYVWDTNRGGELASVEQQSSSEPGWWLRGSPRPLVTPAMLTALGDTAGARNNATWRRVNSTLAWKSVDTIPALSFSTKRGAYYSGEWNVAYANADNKATLKILKPDFGTTATISMSSTAISRKQADELVFETYSQPRIFENRFAPVPWKVKQTVHVFDSGVVILDLEAQLPQNEVYELDWSQMGFNLDDSLYKEPRSTHQALFQYAWAFPGDTKPPVFRGRLGRAGLQGYSHLPLDIDLTATGREDTDKPMLFSATAYDTTHIKGSPMNAFAECALEDARSIIGTTEDFGSLVCIRPAAGMSPPPPWEGSKRPQPCFGVLWNLFDGKVQGLNEELTYRNRMIFAFGQRKRSNSPDAPSDDRNILLGARIYYAKNALPSAQDIQAMSAEGCDTLILNTAWQKDPAATTTLVQAAHAANIRVGVTIDARNLKPFLTDTAWFTKTFQKDRDGVLITNSNFLSSSVQPAEFNAGGDRISFKKLDVTNTNAVSFALCMRNFRRLVGTAGFLIAQEDAPCNTLLQMAECDAFTSASPDPYKNGSPADRCVKRSRAGAGFAPMLDSLSTQWMSLAATYADTPIISWPPRDKQHLAWWKICQKFPKGKSELSLMPVEHSHFDSYIDDVQGTFILAKDGKALVIVTSQSGGNARLSFSSSALAATTLDGQAAKLAGGSLDAGEFTPGQVKAFQLTFRPEKSQ
ncbi:MAG: hypothetical protein FWD61_02495 [Phycisphaerales bacterium]|nr:hypothetical protein [Phycisphaerales bacterium]